MSAGRLLRYTFRGLLSVYSHYGLHARQVAFATLYTGGSSSFVASATAPIATGRSDPVPGRDLHPLLTSAFHGARHSRYKLALENLISKLGGSDQVPHLNHYHLEPESPDGWKPKLYGLLHVTCPRRPLWVAWECPLP